MLDMGLTRAQKRAYELLLRSNHRVHVSIQILNLDHVYLADMSHRLLEGQVDIDASADVSRSLTLSLYDPKSSLDMTSISPDDGALYLDRMVRVVYSIAPPDGSVWYPCPIFCGPITKMDRSKGVVSIEAAGKDHLMYSSVWTPVVYKKGRKKTDVLIDLLRDFGEARYKVPRYKARLPKNLSISDKTVPWKAIRNLASSVNCHAFYDARGWATVRGLGKQRVFVFTEDHVTNVPQFGYSLEGVINAVKVIGGKPKGSKRKIRVKIRVDRSHSLSPWNLGRLVGGVRKPRDYMEIIEDENILSNKEATRIAKSRLRVGILEEVEASFDSVVIPHLEVNDVVGVRVGDFSTSMRYRKASIPLTGRPVGTVGYNKRLSPTKKRIRRNR